MALYDLSKAPYGGRHRILPDSANSPRTKPRLLIYHSIVGSAEGAYNYFLKGTNLESTFIVTKGGVIWQTMDTERESDANYRANPFAISVETEDSGDPDTDPWTSQQLDALVWLAHESHRVHGIPLRRAPEWDSSGVGYHTMFGAPSPWTPVSKTCPGRVRVRQFNDIILPRLGEPYEGGVDPVEVQELHDRLLDPTATYSVAKTQKGVYDPGTTTPRLVSLEVRLGTKFDQLLAALGDLGADTDALLARPALDEAVVQLIVAQTDQAVREVLADATVDVDVAAIAERSAARTLDLLREHPLIPTPEPEAPEV
jgi:hypothetical protein